MIAQIEAGKAAPRRRGAGRLVEADRGMAQRDCLKYKRRTPVIKPQYVVEKLWEVTGGTRRLHHLRRRPAPDVGGAVLQVRRAAPLDQLRRPGHHGRGPALRHGRKLAKPDARCSCVTGEGSIQMCIQELSTCQAVQLPVKIINLNNRYLGMVRQWQEMFYGSRYSESYMDALPDFVKLAEAYGHVGIRVERPEDVEPRCARPSSITRTISYSSISSPIRRRTSFRWWPPARA
jgi:acetolactate synthase-1/2/3 large subunit